MMRGAQQPESAADRTKQPETAARKGRLDLPPITLAVRFDVETKILH